MTASVPTWRRAHCSIASTTSLISELKKKQRIFFFKFRNETRILCNTETRAPPCLYRCSHLTTVTLGLQRRDGVEIVFLIPIDDLYISIDISKITTQKQYISDQGKSRKIAM
jgi:hypothetical protein